MNLTEILHKGSLLFFWQKEFCERVYEKKKWEEHLFVPTGCGKSSLLMIYVFLKALSKSENLNFIPQKLIYVVNRRIVVDENHELALSLQKGLTEILKEGKTKRPITYLVANALKMSYQSLIPIDKDGEQKEDFVLDVHLLRGGCTTDKEWYTSPVKPAIVLSTVDMCGSRVLFNGYGTSFKRRPLDAAYFGLDSLILLDEAHLNKQFSRTMKKVSEFQKKQEENFKKNQGITENFKDISLQFCQMSATLIGLIEEPSQAFSEDSHSSHILSFDDRNYENPYLEKCLTSLISIKTLKVDGSKIETSKKLNIPKIKECINDKNNRSSRVGVIVNTIKSASAIFEGLKESFKNEKYKPKLVLFVGRNSEVAKKEITKDIFKYCGKAKPLQDKNDRSQDIIVVATQCVEVGADLSFDTLFTESCSLDAFIQRIGRLNRFGNFESAKLFPFKQSQKGYKCPVYEDSGDNLFKYVEKNFKKQFTKKGLYNKISEDYSSAKGRESLYNCLQESIKGDSLLVPLREVDINCLQHTEGIYQQFSVDLLLHGIQDHHAPEVSVYFRNCIIPYKPKEKNVVNYKFTNGFEYIESPRSDECISVPLHTVKNLIKGFIGELKGNVEGIGDTDQKEGYSARSLDYLRVPVFEDENLKLEPLYKLKAGDVICLSTWFGAANKFGWAPDYKNFECRNYLNFDSIKEEVFNNHNSLKNLFYFISNMCELDRSALKSEKYIHHGIVCYLFLLTNEIDKKQSEEKQISEFKDKIQAFKKEYTEIYNDKVNENYEKLETFYKKLKVINPKYIKGSLSEAEIENSSDEEMNNSIESLLRDKKFEHKGEPHWTETMVVVLKDVINKNSKQGNGYGKKLTLRQHLEDVRNEFVEINKEVTCHNYNALSIASYYHDIGKAHLGFQRFLDPHKNYFKKYCKNKSEIKTNDSFEDRYFLQEEPLAKSLRALGGNYNDMVLSAGILPGFRHEYLSLVALENNPIEQKNIDEDLVKYLVTTHHGHARHYLQKLSLNLEQELFWQDKNDNSADYPNIGKKENFCSQFFTDDSIFRFNLDDKVFTGNEKQLDKISDKWPLLVKRLKEKYGVWRLAYYENLLRSSDAIGSARASRR